MDKTLGEFEQKTGQFALQPGSIRMNEGKGNADN
jgi:hypothetical protein